eukprot:IDg8803t1
MGKCYCDYCDVFLTHDSVAVRKQHNDGNRHKQNVCEYYRQFIGMKTQRLIDEIVANFEIKVMQGVVRPTFGFPSLNGVPAALAPDDNPPLQLTRPPRLPHRPRLRLQHRQCPCPRPHHQRLHQQQCHLRLHRLRHPYLRLCPRLQHRPLRTQLLTRLVFQARREMRCPPRRDACDV